MTNENREREQEREIHHSLIQIFLKVSEKSNTSRAEEFYDCFTPREKVFMIIFYLDQEVMNGTFHQWISNPTGMYVAETRDALLEIGAGEQAKMVEQAMQTFPGGCPARSYKERQRQLNALDKEQTQFLYDLNVPYEKHRLELLQALFDYWHNSESPA